VASTEIDTDIGLTIGCVTHKLHEIQVEREAHLRATKSRFNLFTVLLGIGDETRLHSNYLAHLLNPNDTHDCGPLFLKLFLGVLREQGVKPHAHDADPETLSMFNGFACDNVRVHREFPVKEGRLDILIESTGCGAIAIENKIWASEGNQQIQRYATFLERSNYPQSVLLYLTLDGKQSKTPPDNKQYYRISYKDHIIPWLEQCLQATGLYVNINQALRQYKDVIHQLVDHRSPLEKQYMDMTINIIKEHPEILTHLGDITDAKDQLMEEHKTTFFNGIRRGLERRGFTIRSTESDHATFTLILHSIESRPIFAEPNMEVGVHLRFSELGLRVGVLCGNDAATKFRSKLMALHEQLVLKYPDHGPYLMNSSYWPLNFLVVLSPCFDNLEYLVGLLKETDKCRTDIEKAVNKIEEYVTDVEAIWREVCPKV